MYVNKPNHTLACSKVKFPALLSSSPVYSTSIFHLFTSFSSPPETTTTNSLQNSSEINKNHHDKAISNTYNSPQASDVLISSSPSIDKTRSPFKVQQTHVYAAVTPLKARCSAPRKMICCLANKWLDLNTMRGTLINGQRRTNFHAR